MSTAADTLFYARSLHRARRAVARRAKFSADGTGAAFHSASTRTALRWRLSSPPAEVTLAQARAAVRDCGR